MPVAEKPIAYGVARCDRLDVTAKVEIDRGLIEEAQSVGKGSKKKVVEEALREFVQRASLYSAGIFAARISG
jgi:hypothetical protein